MSCRCGTSRQGRQAGPSGRCRVARVTGSSIVRRFREGISRYATHARVLWFAGRGWSLVALLCTAVRASAIVPTMVATGRLIGTLPAAIRDGTGSSAADRLWFWFAIFAVPNLGAQFINGIANAARARVSARYSSRALRIAGSRLSVNRLKADRKFPPAVRQTRPSWRARPRPAIPDRPGRIARRTLRKTAPALMAW